MRKSDAWALVGRTLTDFGAGSPHPYSAAVRGVAIVRRESVALVLYNDTKNDYIVEGIRMMELRGLADEGRRRARATEHMCHVACMAYEEGARHALEPIFANLFDRFALGYYAALDRHAPSYTALRNFLIGELDAHVLIACRVAFARTVTTVRIQRHYRDRFDTGAERGWL